MNATANQGVITGCDSKHEWMLKHWWDNYHNHNSYPVTFIDFGMSSSAKLWCEKRGNVHTPKKYPTAKPPPSISPYAEEKRDIWLQKPHALLASTYDQTIWLDIDTKVKKDLAPLFNYCPKNTLAIGLELSFREAAEKETSLIPQKAISFNSGVIVYPSKAPLLSLWAEMAQVASSLGDQDLLSRIIFEDQCDIVTLPTIYNRIYPSLDDDEVVVYHYASLMGQTALYENYNTRERT